MDSRLQHGFSVGEYEIRPLEGRMIGPSGSQHVQPKVMEVLLCLAERPGELVERHTLIRHAWGDAADSDDVLTRCISELRHHLDDQHDVVKYIQTVPKRGYRLVADVTLLADEHSQRPDHASNVIAPAAPPNGEQLGEIARFWKDLERRNVVRVAIAYMVVAWLLLQVGDTVFQALQLPDWALTLLLSFLVLGFPVAVIMAWVFQITPEGVVLDVRDAPKGPISLRRNVDVVIIGALVIAVGILGYRALESENIVEDQLQNEVFPAPPPDNSIAVLRFLNIGGEPHFADGLCEELLDRLAQLSELGVAARTSSWAFAEKDVDVPTIAEQLDVDYVLEGSVRQIGDRIRVTAQLNDGKSGKHVWSQSYDRQLSTANFFETQSEIARQVVSLLRISLSPESEARLSASPRTSFEALDMYLRGQEVFRQPHSQESLDSATSYYRQALEIDPRLAMAYAGLCQAQLGRYIISRNVSDFEESERACHRALTLDEDMPRVVAALGTLYLFSGQYDKAEDVLRKAIDVNPNLIDAYADLAEAVEYQGRIDEAEELFGMMVARQPGYWYAYNALGNFLYRQSRHEEAARVWTTVTTLVPDRAIGYNNVATANYMIGNFDAASLAYERSVEIEPHVDTYSNLGLSYFYDGRFDDAAEMQLRAFELSPNDARVLGRLATAYQYAGRYSEALPIYRDAISLLNEQLVINPNEVRLIRYFAVYNVSISQISEARTAIDRALELQPESSGVRFDAAKVALVAGNVDEALANLELAKELGYSTNIIRSDPAFTSLHTNDRYKIITEQHNKGTER